NQNTSRLLLPNSTCTALADRSAFRCRHSARSALCAALPPSIGLTSVMLHPRLRSATTDFENASPTPPCAGPTANTALVMSMRLFLSSRHHRLAPSLPPIDLHATGREL